MFGLHMPELIIILVIALLIFGPKRLPEMGSSIGKSIKEFRKGMAELTSPKDEKEEEAKLPPASTQVKNEFQSTSTPVNNEVTSNAVSPGSASSPINNEVTSNMASSSSAASPSA